MRAPRAVAGLLLLALFLGSAQAGSKCANCGLGEGVDACNCGNSVVRSQKLAKPEFFASPEAIKNALKLKSASAYAAPGSAPVYSPPTATYAASAASYAVPAPTYSTPSSAYNVPPAPSPVSYASLTPPPPPTPSPPIRSKSYVETKCRNNTGSYGNGVKHSKDNEDLASLLSLKPGTPIAPKFEPIGDLCRCNKCNYGNGDGIVGVVPARPGKLPPYKPPKPKPKPTTTPAYSTEVPTAAYPTPALTPAYSAPAPSYSAPAPSYSAPAPSYTPPAPSYSAPAPSPLHSAPAPASSYSAPAPSPLYSAPAPASSYSAPAPSPLYSAPAQASSYSAPAPASSYSVPAPASSYSAPASSPSYSAPAPAPSYSASESSYSAPVSLYSAPAPSYSVPASEPSYSAPASSYSVPAPSYNAPAAPFYSAPASSYSEPAPSYSAPAAPAQYAPAYQTPAPASYSAPAPPLPTPITTPTSYTPDSAQYAPAYPQQSPQMIYVVGGVPPTPAKKSYRNLNAQPDCDKNKRETVIAPALYSPDSAQYAPAYPQQSPQIIYVVGGASSPSAKKTYKKPKAKPDCDKDYKEEAKITLAPYTPDPAQYAPSYPQQPAQMIHVVGDARLPSAKKAYKKTKAEPDYEKDYKQEATITPAPYTPEAPAEYVPSYQQSALPAAPAAPGSYAVEAAPPAEKPSKKSKKQINYEKDEQEAQALVEIELQKEQAPRYTADPVSVSLAYKNLADSQGKRHVPEDSLAYGHYKEPADGRVNKRVSDFDEEKLHTVDKPVVELKCGKCGNSDCQNLQVSYGDIGYGPVAPSKNRFVPKTDDARNSPLGPSIIYVPPPEDKDSLPCGPLGPTIPGYRPGGVIHGEPSAKSTCGCGGKTAPVQEGSRRAVLVGCNCHNNDSEEYEGGSNKGGIIERIKSSSCKCKQSK